MLPNPGELGKLFDLVAVLLHQARGVLDAAAVDVVAERHAQLVVEELREVGAVGAALGRQIDDRQAGVEIEPAFADRRRNLLAQDGGCGPTVPWGTLPARARRIVSANSPG